MSSDRYERDIARAEGWISGHVMKERVAPSFDFRTPDKGSIYAYALTWSPGAFSLAGDMGEMTITHWQALAQFEPGIRWVADSHWDYLLGKAGSKADVLDRGETAADIVRMAQEDAHYGDGWRLDRLKERYPDAAGYRGAVLQRALRREIVGEIADYGPERIAEFCHGELRFDDYYGAYRRDPHSLHQMAAIQHGARMIAATFASEVAAA